MKKKKGRKGQNEKEICKNMSTGMDIVKDDDSLNSEVTTTYEEVYGNKLRKKILEAMIP